MGEEERREGERRGGKNYLHFTSSVQVHVYS